MNEDETLENVRICEIREIYPLSFTHKLMYIHCVYKNIYILRKRLFKAKIIAECSEACWAPLCSDNPQAKRWVRGTHSCQVLAKVVRQHGVPGNTVTEG